MRTVLLTFFGLFITASEFAQAFPTGLYDCGEGSTTSRIEIEAVTVGSIRLPRLTVTLRQVDLESQTSGLGLLLTTTDKKTGEVERRMRLPGSNVDLKYTEADKLQILNQSKRCVRRS